MSDTGAVLLSEMRDAALAVILLRRSTAAAATQALQAQCGVGLPEAGQSTAGGGVVVLWQGPDRFLAMREGGASGLAGMLAPVLAGLAHVVEASSARVIFNLTGPGAGAALSRMVPLDLHPRAFPPGHVAATVADHIDVLVWRNADSFSLSCGSSFAESMHECLARVVGVAA